MFAIEVNLFSNGHSERKLYTFRNLIESNSNNITSIMFFPTKPWKCINDNSCIFCAT